MVCRVGILFSCQTQMFPILRFTPILRAAIFQMVIFGNLKLLTALGHDGHIYAIEKTSAFEESSAKQVIRQMDCAIDKLLKSTLTDEQVLEKAEGVISDCIKELQKNGAKFYE